MIVVDSSAVVAIVREESEAAKLLDVLDQASGTVMSAVSLVETNMVITGRRAEAETQRIASLLDALGIKIAEVTEEQANLAVEAFLRFGKGRHPARLNLADCFAYALARSRGASLLFKGDDFLKTDVIPAWRP